MGKNTLESKLYRGQGIYRLSSVVVVTPKLSDRVCLGVALLFSLTLSSLVVNHTVLPYVALLLTQSFALSIQGEKYYTKMKGRDVKRRREETMQWGTWRRIAVSSRKSPSESNLRAAWNNCCCIIPLPWEILFCFFILLLLLLVFFFAFLVS